MSSPFGIPDVSVSSASPSAIQLLNDLYTQIKADGSGIVAVMTALLRDQTYTLKNGNVFTRQTWLEAWPAGGAKKVTDGWRVKGNTPSGFDISEALLDENGAMSDGPVSKGMLQGQHEWIPTSCIGYVMETAFTLNHPDEAIAWLQFALMLRSPTRYIVWRIAADAKGCNGHVGSVYKKQGAKHEMCTDGTVQFHDGLIKLLKKHLRPGNSTIDLYAKDLIVFIKTNVCINGIPTQLRQSACPYYYLEGKNEYVSWGNTLGDMADTLSKWGNLLIEELERDIQLFLGTRGQSSGRSLSSAFFQPGTSSVPGHFVPSTLQFPAPNLQRQDSKGDSDVVMKQ